MRLDDLLGDICRDVSELDPLDRKVELEIDVEPLWVSPRIASALAMITAEWVGNALEHGLADRPGRIEVILGSTPSGACLVVADTGAGNRDGNWTPGFGTMLVSRLADQLGACVERTAGRFGSRCELSFAGAGPEPTAP